MVPESSGPSAHVLFLHPGRRRGRERSRRGAEKNKAKTIGSINAKKNGQKQDEGRRRRKWDKSANLPASDLKAHTAHI